MTDPMFYSEATEQDLVEQRTPVVDEPDQDTSEQNVTVSDVEANEADWFEQQSPVTADEMEEYPPEGAEQT